MKRRPCWVEISTAAFKDNYRVLRKAAGPVALLAIVKADAYGHGLSICAPAAAAAGAGWLGVTSVEEGVAAREYCDAAGYPDVQILVISGPFRGQGSAVIASRLTPVIWDDWQLRELVAGAAESGAAGPIPIHLELETGMNRQGVSADSLSDLLDLILGVQGLGSASASSFRLDGLMTHLYAADECDGVTTHEQLVKLERMIEQVATRRGKIRKDEKSEGLSDLQGVMPTWLHVGNSAAVVGEGAMHELEAISVRHQLQPMARPGLALYGLTPEFDRIEAVKERARELSHVLEWKTEVVRVHSIEPGEVVGYNGTFVATEPMQVALLAVGYADGLNRALSNRGAVLVNGTRTAIVGRISMDQTVVDVTGIDGVAAGSEVVLLGRQGSEQITAEEHARWAGTIAWEILTSIASRVERRAV